jgi:hypothetical protein
LARVLYGSTLARPTILRSSRADPGGLMSGTKALKPRTKYFVTSFIATFPQHNSSALTIAVRVYAHNDGFIEVE